MRWHDAAARASFTVFEPENVTSRWAGGFSLDGSVIEVMGALADDEVSVETSRPDRWRPDDLQQRIAMSELIWRYVLGGANELDLPYSVTVEADDRAVIVHSETYTVHGMRVQGDSRWVGTLRVGDVLLKISCSSPAALAFRACEDLSSLPEHPPSAG